MWLITSRAACAAAAIGCADLSVPTNAYGWNAGTIALSASCIARYIMVQPRALGKGSLIAGSIAKALSWANWLQRTTTVALVNSPVGLSSSAAFCAARGHSPLANMTIIETKNVG